jgi:putative Ca2+/H+ antiporter (TMEM165/GDT1 family)
LTFAIVATTFVLVGIAELPDKTMIATLVMGSRGRPGLVWLGASAAFAVHVTLAVVAGHLLTLLPHQVLEIIVTVLFLAGAVYLLLVPEGAEVEKGTREADAEAAVGAGRRRTIVTTAFGVILIGEFGDLTQLLTVNLVAHYKAPLDVFVGALAALVTVSAIGAFGGRALLRIAPVSLIRRIGGVVLVGFAAYSIYSLVTS